MAWETRGGRGHYYTRSRREAGRVVREYVGAGPVGELAAALDRRDRDERTDRRRDEIPDREAVAALDAPMAALHADVNTLVRGALLAAGFHRHKGEWRRRRG